MDPQIIFWFLIFTTFLEVMAIVVLGRTIKSILKSELFRSKMAKVNARAKAADEATKNMGSIGAGIILALLGFLMPEMAMAAAEGTDLSSEAGNALQVNVTDNLLYVLLTLNVLLAGVVIYFRQLLQSLLTIDKVKVEKTVKVEDPAERPMAKIMHILTDAAPLDQEETVATDHEYDGIRELDNNLPPWWKWGFYVSIVVGVIYLIHFHVLETGELQIEEYHSEMKRADAEVQAYLAAQKMNVDESNVVVLNEAGALKRGKGLFVQYCEVCHGASGEGKVGPNLTDQYWIYGGDIADVFKTIKYGAKNGMKSWKDELNPIQIQEVSSFINTLQGTEPDNPKAPQGELYVPDVKDLDTPQADSTTVSMLQ